MDTSTGPQDTTAIVNAAVALGMRDEPEALAEIHQRTVDLLRRRESVAAIPMVAD